MRIDTLFSTLGPVSIHGSGSVEISGISSHSKTVSPGNLFIAMKGNRFDGAQYIEEALSAGAVAILTDMYNPFLSAVQVVHPDPASLVPQLAAKYYGNPSEKMFTVGVTGTNGKTTTAYLIAHLLDPCGLLSTIEYRIGDLHIPARLTTPDLLTTQKLLSEAERKGCRASVMEVSSHGLAQGRNKGITFSAAVFTNLSQDHLDYHGTMEEYFQAKLRLFTDLETTAVINADDPYAERIIEATPANVVTYGVENTADITPADMPHAPLQGQHNVYNTLAAVAVAKLYDIADSEIAEKLHSFPPIPGRMQPVPNDLGLSIFVDFAHTPEALRHALRAVREKSKGKVCVVFGCGGDRDKEKRPLMGKVAREGADHVIVTSDNPRSEDPETICQQVGGDTIIVDRGDAIAVAIQTASPGDTILIAGRGHEPEQIIGSSKRPFLDYAVAKEACENRLNLIN